MRIRWRGVARVAAIAVVGLIALRLLPGLLRAPEPPPLGADVGLPRATPVEREPVGAVVKRDPTAPRKKAHRKVRAVPDEPAATASIGSRKKRRHSPRRPHRPHRTAPVQPSPAPLESTAAAVPEHVPPPPPESVAEPFPEPTPTAPATPGDGSQEFAPH